MINKLQFWITEKELIMNVIFSEAHVGETW